jgi:hypothetical protein
MCQTLTSVNIKKEFTILELSYSIIFPPTIKSLNHDIKKFKLALKEYLLSHSFYSVELPQLKILGYYKYMQAIVALPSCVIIIAVIL